MTGFHCIVGLLGVTLLPTWAQAATVTGTITWSTPIPDEPARVLRDHHFCGQEKPVFRRQVKRDQQARLEGVLIYWDAPPKRLAARPEVLWIKQENCQFSPRLSAARVGTVVRFENRDPVLHALALDNPQGKNLARFVLPIRGQKTRPIKLKKPGLYRVRSTEGHLWSSGHLMVFPHAHYVFSDAMGHFELPDLPVGALTLKAFHPDLGTKSFQVTTSSTGPVGLSLRY